VLTHTTAGLGLFPFCISGRLHLGILKERRYGLTAMWRAHWDLLALSNVALDDGCAISSLSMACHS
jgi:hypothetical protein